jgi:hypothetical protein
VQPLKPRCAKEVCKVTGKDVYELGDISKFLDGQAKSQAGLSNLSIQDSWNKNRTIGWREPFTMAVRAARWLN